MKFIQRKVLILPLVVALVAGGTFAIHKVKAAGSASFSLSPSSSSYNKDTTFNVTLNETSTDAVNGVDAIVNFDTSKLQFISSDISGVAFDYCFERTANGVSNGTVRFACVKNGASYTGTQKVAVLTFKALAGSGSTAVTFNASSQITKYPDASDVWNGTTTGGTYTLTTPAAPPPTNSGGGNNTNSNTNSNNSSSTGGSSSASKPAASGGTSKTATNNNTSTGSSQSTTNTQQSAAPTPTTTTDTGSQQQGYFVAVLIMDDKGAAVAGAKVTIDKTIVVSDGSGTASFTGITAGKHTVKVQSSKGNGSQEVLVSSTVVPTSVQQFKVKVKKSLPVTTIAGVVALLAVLAVGFKVLMNYRNRWSAGPVSAASATVTPAESEDKPLTASTLVMPKTAEPTMAPGTTVGPIDSAAKPTPASTPAPTESQATMTRQPTQVIKPSDKP